MWLSAHGLVLGALCLLLGSISLCCWMGFVLIGWLVLLVALAWLVRTGLDGARVGAAFSQVWENTIIVHLIHILLSPTLALCSTQGTFQSALPVYWSLLLSFCSCLDVTRFYFFFFFSIRFLSWFGISGFCASVVISLCPVWAFFWYFLLSLCPWFLSYFHISWGIYNKKILSGFPCIFSRCPLSFVFLVCAL
jgi:hypothetical protein